MEAIPPFQARMCVFTTQVEPPKSVNVNRDKRLKKGKAKGVTDRDLEGRKVSRGEAQKRDKTAANCT